MNTKNLTALTVAVAVILVGVPAPDDLIDAPAAPMIVTPSELAARAVTLEPDQVLLVVSDAPRGGTFTGTGGSGDDGIVPVDAADGNDNAALVAQKPGTTTAWVSGADGQRVSFDVTVEIS